MPKNITFRQNTWILVLIDHPDGNQFVARIWRTTQKANEELIYTTPKEDLATQKSKTTTQKPVDKCPRLKVLNVSKVQNLHFRRFHSATVLERFRVT